METSSLPPKPETPDTPPAVTVVEISDPTSVGQSIEVIEQDVVQLESKPLRVRRVVVRLGTALVLFHSTNLAVRTRTKLHPDFVAYTAFAPQAIGTVNGLPVGPDRVLTSMPGIEVEFVVAAGYESVTFLLPPDDIRAHLRGRHREDEFHLPYGVKLVTPSPAAARELYRWGRRLTDLAARQPEVFDVKQAQCASHVELLEILLATLRSAVQVESAPRELTRQGHSQVVQIAEDYALSHTAERLQVTDLCEAAGVSERTLQYAFKDLMGMTPMAYLIRLRLHRVRQTLRAATHASTTVSKEALRWGFWHFGDFSRAYKECFGELPSDTLRRSPEVADTDSLKG
jgi:AraC family ethanolamine operon transcriptional activator